MVVRREPVVINGTENVEGMDNMEISHREPEVDEDGFQMVSKKKGGRSKCTRRKQTWHLPSLGLLAGIQNGNNFVQMSSQPLHFATNSKSNLGF